MQVGRSHIISICRAQLLKRKEEYVQELANLDTAAATETKSSAGDKYETGREMIGQTRNLMDRNLHEVEANLSILDRMVNQPSAHPPLAASAIKIGFGSMVESNMGLYLLGISLGEVEIGPGFKITAISLASPLGRELFGKTKGDQIAWKGHHIRILGVTSE